tara:strand:+ start:252 stop:446 length:195 start_codon:yes stop_codon:yes gene_type:complete
MRTIIEPFRIKFVEPIRMKTARGTSRRAEKGQSLSALLLINQADQLHLLSGTLKALCLLVTTLK